MLSKNRKWASAWNFQQCGTCDQQSLRSAWAYASIIVKLLTEHHLEFISLKGGCRGSSESTLVKMSNCWKSHATAQMMLWSKNSLWSKGLNKIVFENIGLTHKNSQALLKHFEKNKHMVLKLKKKYLSMQCFKLMAKKFAYLYLCVIGL